MAFFVLFLFSRLSCAFSVLSVIWICDIYVICVCDICVYDMCIWYMWCVCVCDMHLWYVYLYIICDCGSWPRWLCWAPPTDRTGRCCIKGVYWTVILSRTLLRDTCWDTSLPVVSVLYLILSVCWVLFVCVFWFLFPFPLPSVFLTAHLLICNQHTFPSSCHPRCTTRTLCRQPVKVGSVGHVPCSSSGANLFCQSTLPVC